MHGFKDVDCLNVEGLPLICLVWGREGEFEYFPIGVFLLYAINCGRMSVCIGICKNGLEIYVFQLFSTSVLRCRD